MIVFLLAPCYLDARTKNPPPVTIAKEEVRRILCIKPRGIGDIVLSTIILDNLAAAFPLATIDFLTAKFAMDAVRDHPLVGEVIGMERGVFSTARVLRKRKYDLVIDLWTNPRSAQITLLSGARYRVGYGYRGRRYAYNILATADRGVGHSAEHNLELLKVMDVPVISRRIHFSTRPEEEEAARQWLAGNFGSRQVVGIVPSGGWPSKRAPVATWVAICKAIEREYDIGFVVLWGPGDEADADGIKAGLGHHVAIAPPTTVRAMAGFLKCCALVIANDSGPMHIAAALGVPTVGLFGPTDPLSHGPFGPNGGYVIKSDLHCIVCNKLQCPYAHECLVQISLDAVVAEARKLAGPRLRASRRSEH